MGSAMTNIIIRSVGLLILGTGTTRDAVSQRQQQFQNATTYTCLNGEKIEFLNVCDGTPNCKDRSDESSCDNEAILYYYAYDFKKTHKTHRVQYYRETVPKACIDYGPGGYNYDSNDCDSYQAYKNLTLAGIYLTRRKFFSLSLQNSNILDLLRQNKTPEKYFPSGSNFKNIEIVPSSGPRLNIIYTVGNHLFYCYKLKTRNNTSIFSRKFHLAPNKILSPVFDWTKSKIYYILVYKDFNGKELQRRIMTCDDDNLESSDDLIVNPGLKPTLLRIAPQQDALYLIAFVYGQNYYQLSKYQISNVTNEVRLIEKMWSPRWLTVDFFRVQLYWLDMDNIYTSTLDGMNIQKKSVDPVITKNITSFAVFNDSLYFYNDTMKSIKSCYINFCWNLEDDFLHYDILSGNELQIGNLFIDYRPSKRVQVPQVPTHSP